MEMVRILLADDHAAVRRGIRALLESQRGWIVCCEASDGQEAVDASRRLQPDIVLLDITMPGLGGLEAAAQILAGTRHPHVLLLSVDESEELQEAGRQAGTAGVILKSDAGGLTAAIEALCPRQHAIHLAGAEMSGQRHVAAFFATGTERYRVLAPFVAEGLRHGEKAVHIVDAHDRGVHTSRLAGEGVNVERAMSGEQLEVFDWEDFYLHGGHFEQEAMIGRIQQRLRDGAGDGFPLTRLVAFMEWALVPPPSVETLVEYESRLNHILPQFDDVVICTYDLTKFDGSVILDILRAHPVIVVGGALHENALYTPPDVFLEELRQRRDEAATR